MELDTALVRRLKQYRVRVDAPDEDTLFLRNVPANERCFNKSSTNLLVKRPRTGFPFIVCVDEDLEYRGPDGRVASVFAGAHRQQGWRVLLMDELPADGTAAVERALDAIGFEGRDPVLRTGPVDISRPNAGQPAGLVEKIGRNLTAELSEGRLTPTVGRLEEIDVAITCLLQREPGLTVIAGRSGVGKTNLLTGIAARLRGVRPQWRMWRLDVGEALAGLLFPSEREQLFRAVLGGAIESGRVLGLDRLDGIFIDVPRGIELLTEALDSGSRMIATTMAAQVPRFLAPPLGRRVQIVALDEMPAQSAREVLEAARPYVTRHHGVSVEPASLDIVLRRAEPLAGAWPAKAVALLDRAAARAVLAARAAVTEADVYLAADSFPEVEG